MHSGLESMRIISITGLRLKTLCTLRGVEEYPGTALNIKPILTIDKNGKLQTIDKKRGNKLALKAMVERFNANYDPSVLKTVYLSCADCIDDADMLKTLIEECRPEAEVKITMLSPIIGAHTGPDMLSLIYYGGTREF